MVKLKAFFFKNLYQWIVAYDCLHISNFLDLLFPIGQVFLLYISYILRQCPFALNKI
jgi:hypothetical protein